MSWHGVRKAVDRAGTQLLQKTGMVEKTVDKEFDDEERRFRNMERKAERLYREGKAYLDAVRGTYRCRCGVDRRDPSISL